jgi:uncharacterized integral membrane protein (TIGR00698 family)
MIAAFTLHPAINGAMALVLGFIASYFLGHPFPDRSSKILGYLLKIAVVGLGFGMNLQETLAAGQEGIGLTACFIALTLGVAMLLSWALKLPPKLSYLLGTGTAICGGSAIATVSPIISATEKDISVSIGVVFLLNSVALVIFPFIGHWLELSQYQFGMWAAIAIHDTSSVVGAAGAYGDEALRVATTVKLVRALWIIPVSIFSIVLFRSKDKAFQIPWFIFLFITVIFTKDYLPLNPALVGTVVDGAKAMMVLALFLVGSSLPGINIRSLGSGALVLGLVLWILVSVSSLLLIVL